MLLQFIVLLQLRATDNWMKWRCCSDGLKTCIAQLGNDHSETAQARQRWAFVLAQQSKYQEAEPHVRVSLETFRVSRDVGYPAELLDC